MKKSNGDFSFIKDTVDIQIIINKNGEVEGFFGDAKLDSCSVTNNRGWFGKLLNLNTNYIITGNLNGKIFDRDPLINKEISCPFNMQGSQLKGTAFQRQGMGTFPMVNFQLSKN